MIINNAVVSFVYIDIKLQVDPVLDCSQVVAQVDVAAGLDSR
jgi:hypothetical protein